MPNPNYLKGIRKERKLVNQARAEGLIAFRSAGSHSLIDVCIISPQERVIRFIQCKTGKSSEREKDKALKALVGLAGDYKCLFEVE